MSADSSARSASAAPLPLAHRRAARRGRLLAEPETRLEAVQRRLLRHVPAQVPVPDAAQGCVLGRVAWAGSLDPVFGERLHALAARIDWGCVARPPTGGRVTG